LFNKKIKLRLNFYFKKIILLEEVYGIDYNHELKLLVTGSRDNSIKLHIFSEEKKEFR